MSLAQMKKQNSLDKLLGAAQSETQPPGPKKVSGEGRRAL